MSVVDDLTLAVSHGDDDARVVLADLLEQDGDSITSSLLRTWFDATPEPENRCLRCNSECLAEDFWCHRCESTRTIAPFPAWRHR